MSEATIEQQKEHLVSMSKATVNYTQDKHK